MVNQLRIIVMLFLTVITVSCSTENMASQPNTNTTPTGVTTPEPPTLQTMEKQINYLALGDSYTIGERVCSSCKFPEQLKKSLQDLNQKNSFSVNIIARTGWTTSDLISAIKDKNTSGTYDLVTLLIGVNNQYQHLPFSLYEKEFPELVTQSIVFANGNKKKVLVISIPDYAYTPYGASTGNASSISSEIAAYNAFAKKYCAENNIEFINITDITQQGLANKSLVATDGLHPSEIAYSLFVNRILPKATTAIQN